MKTVISKNKAKNLPTAPPSGEGSSIVEAQGHLPYKILNGTTDAGKETTYD